jgi:hypothetical protein
MKAHPKFFKAHAKVIADELMRVGWTLRHEFRADGSEEPYEYIFEWIGAGEPVAIDPSKLSPSAPR